MMAGRVACSTCVISRISTGATCESMGCVVTPNPSVFTFEVSRTIGSPTLLYTGRFAMPTDELNGPTTAKACDEIALCAAASPPSAVALSLTFRSVSLTPSTPPAALIWSTASCAPLTRPPPRSQPRPERRVVSTPLPGRPRRIVTQFAHCFAAWDRLSFPPARIHGACQSSKL